MGTILGVTIPVFLAILLGRALADRKFLPADFWPSLQRLSYFVFLPLLIVHTLATADFSGLGVFGLVVTIVLTFVAGAVAVLLWRRWSGERPEMTVGLGEASLRANVPLGLGIAFALFGQAGLTLFVLAAIVYLPTVVILGAYLADRVRSELPESHPEPNTRSVAASRPGETEASVDVTGGGIPSGNGEASGEQAFEPNEQSGAVPRSAYDLDGWEGSLRRSASVLIRNPLVIGAVVGLFLNLTGIGLADGLGSMIRALGLAAIPAGILATGAAVDIDKARDAYDEFREEIRMALLLKLIAIPVIAMIIGAVLGLEGITAATVILIAALPNVTPRFTAQEPDASQSLLLPGITSASTILAVVTLPIALWILT